MRSESPKFQGANLRFVSLKRLFRPNHARVLVIFPYEKGGTSEQEVLIYIYIYIGNRTKGSPLSFPSFSLACINVQNG